MAQQPSPKSGGKVSRRDFIKLMAAAGTVLTFAPLLTGENFFRIQRDNQKKGKR
jgi:ubiquinol-cytochrome c reductase iron-sulfur subunit